MFCARTTKLVNVVQKSFRITNAPTKEGNLYFGIYAWEEKEMLSWGLLQKPRMSREPEEAYDGGEQACRERNLTKT